MLITGYDTVVVVAGPVETGIRTMLDGLYRRWPSMVVALDEPGSPGGQFRPWQDTRHELPAHIGEVYVARDADMKQRWDDVGYSLMEGNEGPFAVLYRPCPHPAIEIQFNEQPYEWKEGGFEPYPAVLISAGLSLVTLVTPDKAGAFSFGLLDLLKQSLISQARRR